MRISRLIFVCAAVMLGACVPGNSPLRVTDIFPLKDDCTPNTMVSILSGDLDVSGAGRYIADIHLVSELTKTAILTDENGLPLNMPGVNNFVIEGADFTYTSKNPIISFAAERLAFTGYVLADDQFDLLNFNMIGPNALQKLRDNVTDPTQLTLLTVNFTIKGHLESGQPESVELVSFPITVFNSDPTMMRMCTNGLLPTGACAKTGFGSAGQDGAAIECNP
jgi:hypothetical protein